MVVAAVIDHDDSDVSACSGEFPIPWCLAEDRAGLRFWLLCEICAFGLRLTCGFR